MQMAGSSGVTKREPYALPPPAEPLVISPRRLAAFSDRLLLRDPRGCSRTPGLLPTRDGLLVQGPFQVRQDLLPTRERAVRFADATGDPNPIHREGEVVPGALLAAQLVSQCELLLPRVRLTSLRVSFGAVSWYGRRLRFTSKVAVRDGAVLVESQVHQDQRQVATAVLEGRVLAEVPRLELPLAKVDSAWLLRALAFYGALGIDAEAWFHKEAGPDLSYPIAFLAALPTGDMVRRFQGEGGVLNRLTLEFDARKLPLTGPPEISLEAPARLRQSFNRILTAVKDAVRGTALVLSQLPDELRPSLRGVDRTPPSGHHGGPKGHTWSESLPPRASTR